MFRKGKSKVHMPSEFKKKCHVVIHAATLTASAAGTIPIPIADTIPISATQVGMVIALGKIFDLTISDSVAKACVGVGVAQCVGRTVFSSIIKFIPGIGWAISGVTAGVVTESLGWLIADDFYRIYSGEKPQNIINAGDDVNNLWETKLKK